ncbi:hypothetical protein SEPCBS57363_006730 [Sporothrix epigloea]|uniref:Uncharacterized protein n=1 Tax=Sporothrix epigloea TaxID=1892477 RepID=A0ABP0E7U2_9PEZI
MADCPVAREHWKAANKIFRDRPRTFPRPAAVVNATKPTQPSNTPRNSFIPLATTGESEDEDSFVDAVKTIKETAVPATTSTTPPATTPSTTPSTTPAITPATSLAASPTLPPTMPPTTTTAKSGKRTLRKPEERRLTRKAAELEKAKLNASNE